MSAFTRQLVHTCSIEAPITTQNEVGEPVPQWMQQSTGTPCRFIIKTEKVADKEIGLQTLTTYLLLLDTDINIETGYRIVDIQIEDGLEEKGPFRVEEKIVRRGAKGQNHVSLRLKRTS